jgi:hypothetical protein
LRAIFLAPDGLILGKGTIQVASSHKGAKTRTHGRKVRSIGTKATTRVARKPRADLEQQLEKYRRELAEAREQQRATAEILSVLSSSPADVQPVFDTIVRNFLALCGGVFVRKYLYLRRRTRVWRTQGPAQRQLQAWPVHR